MNDYVPPPVWSFLPFVLLLLAIAVLPLIPRTAHWWEHNRNKLLLAVLLAALTILFYAFLHQGVEDHEHHRLATGREAVLLVLKHAVLFDYVPFIVLLFSLYTISGGILLKGDIVARPITNCAFLGLGAVLASFIGTTGASMLLIRSLLKTNSERKHKAHTVIFFIFIVSNCGGCLTPLGDPPLFLGYLRGVPFWWTLSLFWPWLFVNGSLLVLYFLWDTVAHGRETPRDLRRDETEVERLSLAGGVNFVWLLGVVACVALVDSSRPLPLIGFTPPPFAREGLLLLLTAASWFTTPGNRRLRAENRFNFGAIIEVACLFIGIFICMQPPVEFLQASGSELRVRSAQAFFWATGGLSSFLDNAPTYVVFFETAKALTGALAESGATGLPQLVQVAGGAIRADFLLAVSMGAVFMGANTYIGNGPNFMVKSIAEQSGVRMPSFFGYMAYSVAILIPIFAAVMALFL